METIKVLLVDDHHLMREMIKKLLSDYNDIKVIGEASDGEEALAFIECNVPDIVLLDLKMPNSGGFQICQKMLSSFPDLKIIALTSCNEEPFLSDFLKLGAKGYLTKGCETKHLINALREVYLGREYLCPETAQKLVKKHRGKKVNNILSQLTPKEWTVMLGVIAAKETKEIANQMKIKPKTVNTYRYRIYNKLNVSNNVQLVLLAAKYGLISRDYIQTGVIHLDKVANKN